MKQTYPIDLPTPFQDRDHEALVSVWLTGNLLGKAFRRSFKSQIRSEAQFNLLRVLRVMPGPMSQNDLSKMLMVDKSNVTGLIDGLEKQGLIRRNRVEGDRRSYHITLTSKGRHLTDKMDKIYRQEIRRIMAPLTAKEHGELIRLTRKMRQGIARTS